MNTELVKFQITISLNGNRDWEDIQIDNKIDELIDAGMDEVDLLNLISSKLVGIGDIELDVREVW